MEARKPTAMWAFLFAEVFHSKQQKTTKSACNEQKCAIMSVTGGGCSPPHKAKWQW
jgi:hypothetical protein